MLAAASLEPRDIRFSAELELEWPDAQAQFPFRFLRAACPCASCVDELSGKRILDPAQIAADVSIVEADYVGRYALRILWSDGHKTGIYSFQFLRQLFEAAQTQGFPKGGVQLGNPRSEMN